MNGRVMCLVLATACSAVAESAIENTLDGMNRWGSGEFRRYGFSIYDATLWSMNDDPTQPPLALQLTYKRRIEGRAIVAVSIEEIRKASINNDAQLNEWEARMAKLFPDVRAGDRIVGVYTASGAAFYHNEKYIGTIADAHFARAFFDIWLSEKTSAPELRRSLLKRVAQ